MTVVGHQQFIPINLIHGHQIGDGFLESAESFVVLQVADVLADEGLAVHHQRDGVFQIGAQREDRTLARQRRHCPGSIAARPPQNDRTESAIANHGIVHPARDRPLPDQECVRDAGETLQRIFVFVGDRFTRSVGAGHDHSRRRARRKQQVMQRSVGKHHSQFVVLRRHSGQLSFCRRKHYRPSVRSQQVFAVRRKLHQPASFIKVAGHDRERLLLAIFTLAQSRHGRGISGIAGQVISAQPLYCDNLSRVQQVSRMVDGGFRSWQGLFLRLQIIIRARTPDTLPAAHGSGGCLHP